MNELIIVSENDQGQQVVSARELHAFLNAGSNVSTWFRNQAERAMLEDGDDFIQIFEESTGGRPSIDFAITLNAAKEISMLNGGEKGKQARKYFIECEKQLKEISIPKSLPEALRAYAAQVEQTQQAKAKLLEAETVIEQQKSKVVFADSVMGSGNSILVREFAKDLSDSGFKIGQNRLFDWLKDHKYLMNTNEPYQKYIDNGIFEVVTRSVGSAYGTFTKKTTKVTGKGQVYLAEKIKQSGLNEYHISDVHHN